MRLDNLWAWAGGRRLMAGPGPNEPVTVGSSGRSTFEPPSCMPPDWVVVWCGVVWCFVVWRGVRVHNILRRVGEVWTRAFAHAR